jgi:hypothetical protein
MDKIVIRIRKSKDRQLNGQNCNQDPKIKGQTTQWTKRKRTNNDLQNITQKTKDRATRTPLKDTTLMTYICRHTVLVVWYFNCMKQNCNVTSFTLNKMNRFTSH